MKYKRINVMVPEELHRESKSLLAIMGMTFKEWITNKLEDLVERGRRK